MKKRVIAVLILTALLLSVFTGCSNNAEPISQEKAQQIAIAELGIAEDQVTNIHIHGVSENNTPCYSVHLTTTSGEFSVLIHARTGEVLESGSGANH